MVLSLIVELENLIHSSKLVISKWFFLSYVTLRSKFILVNQFILNYSFSRVLESLIYCAKSVHPKLSLLSPYKVWKDQIVLDNHFILDSSCK